MVVSFVFAIPPSSVSTLVFIKHIKLSLVEQKFILFDVNPRLYSMTKVALTVFRTLAKIDFNFFRYKPPHVR